MKLIEASNEWQSYCIGGKHRNFGKVVDMMYIPVSQWNYDDQIFSTKDYIQIDYDGGYVVQLYDFKELIYEKEKRNE